MQNVMSIERNEMFDLAFRFVTETSENIFLTGKAGTGKTTFLKYLKENCSKNIIVAAPTGVAAINAAGVTLHSLFQLPFHPFLPTKNNKEELLQKIRYNKQRQQLLRKMELLVIDEISMVRCDTMDAIDTILKSVRRKHDLPFGGVQLLCIGDLHQLPPVAQRHDWQILQDFYQSEFFFDSNVIREQMPLLIELDKIYRQKEDSFVALLNKVRNNIMDQVDFENLHSRFNPSFRPLQDEKFVTLTSHNNQADQINARELQKLLSPTFTYEAIIEDDFPENNYPAEGKLILKEGAQVMFLKNDTVLKRYFNGKIGVVKKLSKNDIVVESDGIEIVVSMETWENSRYILDRVDGKLQQEILGTFTQFPLRLAWAITIHKSQGLTFEKVMIDAGAAFSSGQVYVALSRCTSLEGIVLLSKIPSAAIYSNGHVIKGQQSLIHRGSLEDRFAGARQIFTLQLLEEVFFFGEVETHADTLLRLVNLHKASLNEDGIKWVEEIQNSFSATKTTGVKFIGQICRMMKDEPVIEKNESLKERIMKAADHFEPIFSKVLQSIQNHPLTTELRETASNINETLNQFALSVHNVIFCLKYCRQPFSVTSFLAHKLKLAQPKFNLTIYASGKKQSFVDVNHPELYNELRQWRDRICNDSGVPIFMVANQKSLKEIATYLPMTKKDLIRLSGFGKAKAEKYGDDILEIVQEYCTRNHLGSNMDAKTASPGKERNEKPDRESIDTKTISFNLFNAGNSISEIAKERSMAIVTIEGHLAFFIAKGEIDINKMVSTEKQSVIDKVVAKLGSQSFKTLKENLPAEISYGEIKMVLASRANDDRT